MPERSKSKWAQWLLLALSIVSFLLALWLLLTSARENDFFPKL